MLKLGVMFMGLFRLVKRLLRVRVKVSFEYRIEWLFMLLLSLTTCASAPVFWYLFTGGNEFNGWSFVQLTLLSITAMLGRNITYLLGIDPWIKEFFKYKLTVYMTKPVNTLGYMCLRHGSVKPVLQIIIFLISLYLIHQMFGVEVNLMMFSVFMIFSVMIHAILFLAIIIVAIFWYDSAHSFENIVYSLLNVSRNPLDRVKGDLMSLILIPLLFVAVYPSKAFTGDLPVDWVWVGEVFLTLSFILFLEYRLWEYGLKKYESFGG